MSCLRFQKKTKYGKSVTPIDFSFNCASMFEGCLETPLTKVGSRWFVPSAFFCWIGLTFLPDVLRGVMNLNPLCAYSHKRLLLLYCHLVSNCGAICLGIFSSVCNWVAVLETELTVQGKRDPDMWRQSCKTVSLSFILRSKLLLITHEINYF